MMPLKFVSNQWIYTLRSESKPTYYAIQGKKKKKKKKPFTFSVVVIPMTAGLLLLRISTLGNYMTLYLKLIAYHCWNK